MQNNETFIFGASFSVKLAWPCKWSNTKIAAQFPKITDSLSSLGSHGQGLTLSDSKNERQMWVVLMQNRDSLQSGCKSMETDMHLTTLINRQPKLFARTYHSLMVVAMRALAIHSSDGERQPMPSLGLHFLLWIRKNLLGRLLLFCLQKIYLFIR